MTVLRGNFRDRDGRTCRVTPTRTGHRIRYRDRTVFIPRTYRGLDSEDAELLRSLILD